MGLGAQASRGDLPVQGAQGGALARALTAQHEGTPAAAAKQGWRRIRG